MWEQTDLQPLLRTTELPGGDTRNAFSLEVVLIDCVEQQVDGVDLKGSTAEGQRDNRGACAWDSKMSIAALRSGDPSMDCFSVSAGNVEEGGACVQDSSTTLKAEVFTVNGDGDTSLPETIRADVREGYEGAGVEFGLVKTSECNFAVVVAVRGSAELVRRDSLVDKP